MPKRWKRREIIKQGIVSSAALFLPHKQEEKRALAHVAGRDCEIRISPVSASTFRLSIVPIERSQPTDIPFNGSLVKPSWGPAVATLHGELREPSRVRCGDLTITISPDPLTFSISSAKADR